MAETEREQWMAKLLEAAIHLGWDEYLAYQDDEGEIIGICTGAPLFLAWIDDFLPPQFDPQKLMN